MEPRREWRSDKADGQRVVSEGGWGRASCEALNRLQQPPGEVETDLQVQTPHSCHG